MNFKQILGMDISGISFRILKFCLLWTFILILLLLIFHGVVFLSPLIKNILKFSSIISSELKPQTVFEIALNSANFAVVYITVLFTIMGIVVALMSTWWYRSLKRLEKCQGDYEKFKKNSPLDAKLTTAKIFYAQKDYSLAWEFIKDLPDEFSYEVPLYKGRILFKKEKGKNYLSATELLNKALEFPNITKEGEAIVYSFMASIFIGAQSYKQALIYSKKSIAKKDMYWPAHINKAIAQRHLYGLEKLHKAIETLENILKIDSAYSYAHYNLACYYCLLFRRVAKNEFSQEQLQKLMENKIVKEDRDDKDYIFWVVCGEDELQKKLPKIEISSSEYILTIWQQSLEKETFYKEKIIRHLETAIKLRTQFKKTAEKDEDFDNIKEDPEFKKLIE